MAVNTVSRPLMMESKSVRNMQSSLPKESREVEHLVGFYYTDISRCTISIYKSEVTLIIRKFKSYNIQLDYRI